MKVTHLTAKQMADPRLRSIRATAEVEAALLEKLQHPNVVRTYGCLSCSTAEGGWEMRLLQVGGTLHCGGVGWGGGAGRAGGVAVGGGGAAESSGGV